jgi:hypothetical protein
MKIKKNIPLSFSDNPEVRLSAPKSWKELSAGQLVYISWLMTHTQLSKEELHAYAFVRFTGIKVEHNCPDGRWLCCFKDRRFTLSPEQALSLCRQFSWLTGSIGEVTPLPKLAGVARQDVRLRGLPLIQYIACENYYQAFIHSGDEQHLNCLIASFYLGNEKFNDALTAERSSRFRNLPFHIRYTVFLWYYGLKTVFQRHFPYFFQKTEPVPEDGEPQAPNMREHIDNMLRALTGGDVTKTEAVYQTETWTAFAELNAKAREYRELEARMKRTKN